MATLPTLDRPANAPEVSPLPSTRVTRLRQYYEPLRLPAQPDASLASRRLVRKPPDRVSRVASSTPLPRAIVITSAEHEDQDVRMSSIGGLPRSGGGSASATNIFEACMTFNDCRKDTPQPTLWPVGSPNRLKRPLDIEGSRRLVASPTTSTASGWNVSCRVGLAPTGNAVNDFLGWNSRHPRVRRL
jgi:hypothetical protein